MNDTNNYTLRVNLTSTVYNGPSTQIAKGNGSLFIYTSGSNYGVTQSVGTASWVQVPTGSLTNTNLDYVFLQNTETASLYNVDVGVINGSTVYAFSTMYPQDFLVLPASSSAIYYMKSTLSASVVNVVLTER